MDKDIPIVEAIPVASVPPFTDLSTQVSASGVYAVELPQGYQPANLGIELRGTPPTIAHVAQDGPMAGKLTEGHYVHGIAMPDIEILNLVEPTHALQLLTANVDCPRQLLCSSSPYFADGSIGNDTTRGALYKHTIPATQDLGFDISGFPPAVTFVAPNSVLGGKFHPGQTIVALLIPGHPPMNLQAGGFTSINVAARLAETCHMEGRRLVVRDGVNPRRQKGSNRAFDDCVIS